jgi:hypothetical protein
MRLFLAASSILAIAAAPALATGFPPLVKLALDHQAQDVAGVMAFEARADLQIDVPMTKRAMSWRAWVIDRDGQAVATKILALTADGKPAGAAEREKMETKINEHVDKTQMPFDRRYASRYVFAPAPCADCEPGAQAFSFRSTLRDKDHGDGVLLIGKDARIHRMNFTPCEMPDHVSSANVVLKAAPIGPNWWGVTNFSTHFAGGVGPLQGGMKFAQSQSGYRRFASVEAARAAMPH